MGRCNCAGGRRNDVGRLVQLQGWQQLLQGQYQRRLHGRWPRRWLALRHGAGGRRSCATSSVKWGLNCAYFRCLREICVISYYLFAWVLQNSSKITRVPQYFVKCRCVKARAGSPPGHTRPYTRGGGFLFWEVGGSRVQLVDFHSLDLCSG